MSEYLAIDVDVSILEANDFLISYGADRSFDEDPGGQ